MTIEKSIEYFITSLNQMQLSTHTLRAYKQDLDQWQDSIQKINLNDLQFEDFQEYLIMLQQLNLKPATLRRKRVVIHRYLKYCYNKKLTNQELHGYIDPIRVKKYKEPKEILTQHDLKRIFDYLDAVIQNNLLKLEKNQNEDFRYYCAIRNKLLIKILLYTGCRATELVSLKKQDLNYEQNTVTILAKGHKYNVIPLHEELILAFEEYESQCTVITSETTLNIIKQSNYLFPSKRVDSQHISTRTLHDLMLNLSNAMSRHIHAHLFRHTFASYCIAANMDISTISSLISHSNPSITLSVYTHEIEANQKQKEIKKLTFNLS